MISLSACLSQQVVGENRYIVGKFMLIYVIIWNDDVFLSLMVNRSKYCRSKFQKFDAMQFVAMQLYCPEVFFLSFFSCRQMLRIRILYVGFSPLPRCAVQIRSAQENMAIVSVYTIHLTFFFFKLNHMLTFWLIDDRLYSAILRSLEQTHCACMWFCMSD